MVELKVGDRVCVKSGSRTVDGKEGTIEKIYYRGEPEEVFLVRFDDPGEWGNHLWPGYPEELKHV